VDLCIAGDAIEASGPQERDWYFRAAVPHTARGANERFEGSVGSDHAPTMHKAASILNRFWIASTVASRHAKPRLRFGNRTGVAKRFPCNQGRKELEALSPG
jgi:hypothetical protein